MGARVKICGVASAADAQAVAALQPDFMGFIFWPGSKRFVTPQTVGAWAKDLPPIPRVGVFVDATPDEVARAAAAAGLSVAQLHGGEDVPAFRAAGCALWKVVKIAPVALAAGLPPPAVAPPPGCADAAVDAFLIDTLHPTAPGGTGETGDWTLARDFVAAAGRPVLLAGGLTPANVAAAIRIVRPWGVDVSSGVEQRPGVKDLNKVKEFIHAARTD